MDKGELFKSEFRIVPGRDGTFIVRSAIYADVGDGPERWGFSNIDDLMSWLNENRPPSKYKHSTTTITSDGKITHTGLGITGTIADPENTQQSKEKRFTVEEADRPE